LADPGSGPAATQYPGAARRGHRRRARAARCDYGRPGGSL
jgi:hypothetical protein